VRASLTRRARLPSWFVSVRKCVGGVLLRAFDAACDETLNCRLRAIITPALADCSTKNARGFDSERGFQCQSMGKDHRTATFMEWQRSARI
jgi:hypothetical protein